MVLSHTEESLEHMLFHCPYSSSIWRKFHIQTVHELQNLQGAITNTGLVPPPQRKEWTLFIAIAWNIWLARNRRVFDKEWTLFIAIAWNIWLARNRRVFDNATIPTRTIEANCIDSIRLWVHRCKKTDRREAIREWAAANQIMQFILS
jgi:hypothetical protein